jgi:cytochrome bd ubiquinol oxidase subunit II
MSTSLPIVWSAVIGFALVMYVAFDGMDLGVGSLLLFTRHENERDRMVTSIAPVWDGNETWIVLAGVGLFGGFPLAYATLLPAFYLPLVTMLLALAFRGCAFEFRFSGNRRRWDVAFGAGSIVAALAQGLVLGGLIAGVRVAGAQFAGSLFDVFRPLGILTAAAVLSGYLTLGNAWLILKMDGTMQRAARRRFALGAALFGIFETLVFFTAVRHLVGSTSVVATVAFVTSVAALLASVLIARRGERAALAGPLVAVAAAFIAIAACRWPYIVPPTISIWDASAPPASQLLLFVAVAVVLPIILGYSSFAYYVFRGKTPAA